MRFPHILRPHVHSYPTLETAIWFEQLRWVAVAGQLLTMFVVAWGLRIELPILGLLSLIGVTAVSNAGYALWLRYLRHCGIARSERLPSDQIVSALMLIDILVLTGMLYLSAGIANPFALFYFVNIAVAGAIIAPQWAWCVWLGTVAGVTLLLVRSLPIAELSSASLLAAFPAATDRWTIPKIGFLVSFATCSGVITYFITMLTGELRQREQALKDAEDARVRNRQLEALATLAAGAAHELASPLTTIAVVAKELSRGLEKYDVAETLTKDVALIRSELNRCRQILDRMTSTAGEAAGEQLRTISIESFLAETLLGLRAPERVHLKVSNAARATAHRLPVQAAAQAIRNLIQNALDASLMDQPVELEAYFLPDQSWKICVVDYGTGMAPEILHRIGQPFFTTKEPGRGMGLGLHLTQNVLRRLGGTLDFASRPGQGTIATVVLPLLHSPEFTVETS